MIFHFCKAGETLLSIAREYGISPVRLLEENALSDPDRLAVGQCLVIYRSAKSYTVRGGDTLTDICRRFRTSVSELRKFNPSIGEKHLLYPGQTLALGRAEAPLGCLSVNGIASPELPIPILSNFASALTYLTIVQDADTLRSGKTPSKCADMLAFAKQKRLLPLLWLPRSQISETLLKNLPRHGFEGVLIESDGQYSALAEAIAVAKSHGLAVGLSGHISDALLPLRADFIAPQPYDARDGFYTFSVKLRHEAESELYLMMPLLPRLAIKEIDGRQSENSLPVTDCAAFAYKRNVPIERGEDGRPFIHYGRTSHGKAEDCTIRFEDLASIKTGLTEIGESGMSGVTLYLESTPPSVCTLLHQCFDIIRAGGGKDGEHSHL